MSEAEQATFEQRLANEPDLRTEVDIHQGVMGVAGDSGLQNLFGELEKADQSFEHKSSAKVLKLNYRRLLSAAAAILLLLGALLWIFDSEPSSEVLYATHFEPYIMVLNQRTGSEENVLLKQATSAYSEGNYSASADSFLQLAEDKPSNISYQFYSGISLLAANKANEAIPILEEISRSGNPSFGEQSRWYLALAYLQTDDKVNAKNTLFEIKEGAFRYQEAQEILSSLD